MAGVLDSKTIRDALNNLPGWSGDTDGIERTADLPDFASAIRVVDDVAVAAEQADHHPDIDIRWRTLTFRCSTHSEGGVTDRDLRLAERISQIVGQHGG
ncbi:MAG: 4a-hydroxytetrahydrobiopterin dehydratase [Mycobacteriales bacterium]